MFSWVPLCHGECGSQNWICAPVAILISAYLAISPTLIPAKRRVQVRRQFRDLCPHRIIDPRRRISDGQYTNITTCVQIVDPPLVSMIRSSS